MSAFNEISLVSKNYLNDYYDNNKMSTSNENFYVKVFLKMNRKKILNGGKKFYIHPIFTNYACSKDGEILNVKTGRILKKNLTYQGYQARRRGGSKGSKEPPLKFDNGGLKYK